MDDNIPTIVSHYSCYSPGPTSVLKDHYCCHRVLAKSRHSKDGGCRMSSEVVVCRHSKKMGGGWRRLSSEAGGVVCRRKRVASYAVKSNVLSISIELSGVVSSLPGRRAKNGGRKTQARSGVDEVTLRAR